MLSHCVLKCLLEVTLSVLVRFSKCITSKEEEQRKKQWLEDFFHSTVHSLSCLTYRVYNQSQSISSNHWIVNHYENLHFMNTWCEPSALNSIPLHCISYSGYRPNYDKEKALSLNIWRCSQTWCPQRTTCETAPISEMFNLLCLFYRTASTGAVLL